MRVAHGRQRRTQVRSQLNPRRAALVPPVDFRVEQPEPGLDHGLPGDAVRRLADPVAQFLRPGVLLPAAPPREHLVVAGLVGCCPQHQVGEQLCVERHAVSLCVAIARRIGRIRCRGVDQPPLSCSVLHFPGSLPQQASGLRLREDPEGCVAGLDGDHEDVRFHWYSLSPRRARSVPRLNSSNVRASSWASCRAFSRPRGRRTGRSGPVRRLRLQAPVPGTVLGLGVGPVHRIDAGVLVGVQSDQVMVARRRARHLGHSSSIASLLSVAGCRR